jgi:hypothetical protein
VLPQSPFRQCADTGSGQGAVLHAITHVPFNRVHILFRDPDLLAVPIHQSQKLRGGLHEDVLGSIAGGQGDGNGGSAW